MPAESLQALAQQRLPELANQRQLLAQRTRRAHRRRAQQLQQVHRLGARKRNQRPRGKVLRQLLRHLAVNRLLGQRLLFEKLFEWLESLVAVGRPQQQQLFQRGGPMRDPARSRRPAIAAASPGRESRSMPGNCSTKVSSMLVQRLGAHLR